MKQLETSEATPI
uniref:Uncharacterized protein n=1 Tax=Arundo donax TaxID=35708 RepID=A0A0A9CH96_ARUDO